MKCTTDTKPKLKTHYRAHRLSFWLNLVPDLHNAGNDDVPYSHHQLIDDDSDRLAAEPTVKPLNPQGKDTANNASYSLFTTQMFSLLNLSSSSSSANNKSKQTIPTFSDEHETNELHGTNGNEDGFAAYSTALSVTIVIGCSLLILNVLIFAGVYYQRDKTRLNEPRGVAGGTQMTHGQLNSVLKKRNENGQMPNNICGDLETLTIHSKNDPTTILGHHHTLQHHQLPPPEFADIPQRAPPPPKHMKTMIVDGGINVTTNQMMPAHAMQLMNAPPNCTGGGGGGNISLGGVGTLQKKSCVKNSNTSANMQAHHQQSHHQQSHGSQNQMDELRV